MSTLEEQIALFIQNNIVQGAIGLSAVPFLYKTYRILREDRKVDKLDEEEDKFRLMLRDESKESKDRMLKIMEEKMELLSEVARLQTENVHLLEKIKDLTETIASLRNNS